MGPIDYRTLAQMLMQGVIPVADNPLARRNAVNPLLGTEGAGGPRQGGGGAMPPRSLNTMSDAISISSPNGRVSARAQEAAQQRLGEALFGPGGLQRGTVAQPKASESLMRQAQQMRDLASRGMKPRAHNKKADELEAEAARLISLGE